MSITLTDSAIQRIYEIRKKDSNKDKFLRISISGGGCNGFQYLFDLDTEIQSDDIKIHEEANQILALTDPTSLEMIDGCTIDFIRELGSSYFKVTNPNATNSCGCGSSFSV